MPVSRDNVESAFKELGLTVETDGKRYLHRTAGRYAPLVSSLVTLDEDGTGATLTTILEGTTPKEKRATVCELLNLVHGQSLWNVRFHLDTEGRVFSIGKFLTWGRPFNSVQFGDVFFSSLVTTDRLYPCLKAVNAENQTAEEAFKLFFTKPGAAPSTDD